MKECILSTELAATVKRVEIIKNNVSDNFMKVLCENVLQELTGLTKSVNTLVESHNE